MASLNHGCDYKLIGIFLHPNLRIFQETYFCETCARIILFSFMEKKIRYKLMERMHKSI